MYLFLPECNFVQTVIQHLFETDIFDNNKMSLLCLLINSMHPYCINFFKTNHNNSLTGPKLLNCSACAMVEEDRTGLRLNRALRPNLTSSYQYVPNLTKSV